MIKEQEIIKELMLKIMTMIFSNPLDDADRAVLLENIMASVCFTIIQNNGHPDVIKSAKLLIDQVSEGAKDKISILENLRNGKEEENGAVINIVDNDSSVVN